MCALQIKTKILNDTYIYSLFSSSKKFTCPAMFLRNAILCTHAFPSASSLKKKRGCSLDYRYILRHTSEASQISKHTEMEVTAFIAGKVLIIKRKEAKDPAFGKKRLLPKSYCQSHEILFII